MFTQQQSSAWILFDLQPLFFNGVGRWQSEILSVM